MPNTDSTGKKGRSMDCSQLMSFRKKAAIVTLEYAKDPKADQSQKPMFNRDFKNTGNSQNGASWFYNERGNALVYKRFF
jgi:hypothetical protein